MKQTVLFFVLVVIGIANIGITNATPINVQYVRFGGTFDSNTQQMTGGTTYTDQQTVWIDCNTTSLTVSIPIVPQYTSTWYSSSNFSLSAVGGVSFIQTLQLDPTKGDGWITVVYRENGYSSPSALAIYIKQKPSVPTLVASNVCAGGSATFTASSTYGLQSAKPMSLVWQTTGGVTVNSTNNYTQPNVTVGSVTIANSSTGNVSVRAVVPGCSNLQTSPAGRELGVPSIKNPSYWLFDPGSNMWQFSQISEYPITTYAFTVTSGSASIIQNSGDAYITTSTGATICVTGTNVCGNGTPYCFSLPASGGMLRTVSPNPAQNELFIQFSNAERMEFLPEVLNLYHESSASATRSVSIKDAFESKALIDGDKLKISVSDLPRGIYYLHAVPAQGSKQDIQKVRIVLK